MSEGRITFPLYLVKGNVTHRTMKDVRVNMPVEIGGIKIGDMCVNNLNVRRDYYEISTPTGQFIPPYTNGGTVELEFYINDANYDLADLINKAYSTPKKKVYINGKCVGEVDTDRDVVIK